MAIKLSTGKVAFPITIDEHHDTIYFNPADPDLAVRLKKFIDEFPETIKAYAEVNIAADGQPEDSSVVDGFAEMQAELCRQLDVAIGGDVSSVVFKYCSPFADVGGVFFMQLFAEALGKEIKAYNDKLNKKRTEQINKHIGKYKK